MPKKTFKKDWSGINKKIKDRKKKFSKDERLFEATFNDKNQAKVVMRFLDAPDIDMPYAEQLTHFFSDVGGWCIDNCPSTIGEKCPICDDLYANNYYETDNDLYYDRKKNTNYYTNVLIIEDKNNPSNEGKVFLFRFGVKIMEKIDDIIDEGKMPWDDNLGVNFIFSAKKNGKQSNYDASRFSDTETALEDYGDEDEILGKRHELACFSDPSEYKSYDELKKKYLKAIGESDDSASTSGKKRTRKPVEEDVEEEEYVEDTDTVEDIGDENMFDEDEDDDGFFDDLEDED